MCFWFLYLKQIFCCVGMSSSEMGVWVSGSPCCHHIRGLPHLKGKQEECKLRFSLSQSRIWSNLQEFIFVPSSSSRQEFECSLVKMLPPYQSNPSKKPLDTKPQRPQLHGEFRDLQELQETPTVPWQRPGIVFQFANFPLNNPLPTVHNCNGWVYKKPRWKPTKINTLLGECRWARVLAELGLRVEAGDEKHQRRRDKADRRWSDVTTGGTFRHSYLWSVYHLVR